MAAKKYYLLYKPFGYLSQFTTEHGKKTLGDLHPFEKDVYPLGRLDENSEGLLLLSNDKKVNSLLLDPAKAHKRTYLVQVEGQINNKALKKLAAGVDIKLKNGETYSTLPAKAKRIGAPKLPDRVPAISFNREKGNCWINLTLTEGKYRQVRKMTAAIDFPTIRLVRHSIEEISLGDMQPGDVKEIPRDLFYKKLHLG